MIFVTQSSSCFEVIYKLRARDESWLVRSPLNRAVRVRAMTGYIAYIGTREFNAEGNPAMD